MPEGAAGPEHADAAMAQEILRQAQTLLQAQVDASKVVDAKLMSILQASLSLMVAALGGAAFAFAPNAWVPAWAGVGLATTAAMFGVAASAAVWSLRFAQIGAPAIRPMTLIDSRVHELPARQGYLAIAFELNRVIEVNDRAARRSASRAAAAFYFALAGPAAGAIAAAVAAHGNWRGAVGTMVALGGPVAVLAVATRLFGVAPR
jgi:hypothetical protein